MTVDDKARALLPELIPLLARHNRPGVALDGGTDLTRDLALDSLALMGVVAEIEDHFDVSIPLNALPDVRTVGDLARMLAVLKGDAARG